LNAMEFLAGADDDGRRIDRVLRKAMGGLGLSAIHACLRRGDVRVNGLRAGADQRLKSGDRISVSLPASIDPSTVRSSPSTTPRGDAEHVWDALVFESEHILALNKPRGRLVHGPGGLESDVAAYLQGNLPPSISFRPGPCHRLDRNTSGVLVFAKSIIGAREARLAFSGQGSTKLYLAVLDGLLESVQEWLDLIDRDQEIHKSFPALSGGREARSLAMPLAWGGGKTLAALRIASGRTHQIRVQAASRFHPLSGDLKYGGSAMAGGYILHCAAIGFKGYAALPTRIAAAPPEPAVKAMDGIFGEGAASRAYAEALDILVTG